MAVLIIIFLIAILLYIMPIQIKLRAIRNENNDVILIRIKTLYGIVNLKFEVPFLNVVFKDKKPAIEYVAEVESNKTSKLFKKLNKLMTIPELKKMYRIYKNNKFYIDKLIKYISRKTKIQALIINVKLGTEDVALTSILCGILWAAIGDLIAILDYFINISIKEIKVNPVFDKSTVNMEFSCIITIKLGHIINTGIKVLVLGIRHNKKLQFSSS